jgi:hypothetical protein
MPKRNNLKILQDAVARIRRVIENDDGQNPVFSQAMAIYEKKWLDEFYTEATKSTASKRKAIGKPRSSENQPSKADGVQQSNR